MRSNSWNNNVRSNVSNSMSYIIAILVKYLLLEETIRHIREYSFYMWLRETEEAHQGMMFTREKSKDIGAVETLRYFSPFLSRFSPPMDNHPCAKIHPKIRYRRYLHVIWGYLYHPLLRSHLMDGRFICHEFQ